MNISDINIMNHIKTCHMQLLQLLLKQQPLPLHIFFFRKLLCVLTKVNSLERIFIEMSINDQTESKHQAEESLI